MIWHGIQMAAVAGAAVVSAEFAIVSGIQSVRHGDAIAATDLPYAVSNLVMFAGYAFVGAYVAFLIGLLMVAWPVWRLLEGLGRRSGTDAAVAGAVLAGGAAAGLVLAMEGWQDGRSVVIAGLSVGVAGAAAGWTLRWDAFGPRSEHSTRP